MDQSTPTEAEVVRLIDETKACEQCQDCEACDAAFAAYFARYPGDPVVREPEVEQT